MKTSQQIQRAHDIIVNVLMGHVSIELGREEKIALTRLGDCLCWVLGHETGPAANMQAILDEIERTAAESGLALPASSSPIHDPSRN